MTYLPEIKRSKKEGGRRKKDLSEVSIPTLNSVSSTRKAGRRAPSSHASKRVVTSPTCSVGGKSYFSLASPSRPIPFPKPKELNLSAKDEFNRELEEIRWLKQILRERYLQECKERLEEGNKAAQNIQRIVRGCLERKKRSNKVSKVNLEVRSSSTTAPHSSRSTYSTGSKSSGRSGKTARLEIQKRELERLEREKQFAMQQLRAIERENAQAMKEIEKKREQERIEMERLKRELEEAKTMLSPSKPQDLDTLKSSTERTETEAKSTTPKIATEKERTEANIARTSQLEMPTSQVSPVPSIASEVIEAPTSPTAKSVQEDTLDPVITTVDKAMDEYDDDFSEVPTARSELFNDHRQRSSDNQALDTPANDSKNRVSDEPSTQTSEEKEEVDDQDIDSIPDITEANTMNEFENEQVEENIGEPRSIAEQQRALFAQLSKQGSRSEKPTSDNWEDQLQYDDDDEDDGGMEDLIALANKTKLRDEGKEGGEVEQVEGKLDDMDLFGWGSSTKKKQLEREEKSEAERDTWYNKHENTDSLNDPTRKKIESPPVEEEASPFGSNIRAGNLKNGNANTKAHENDEYVEYGDDFDDLEELEM